jgi:GNAT superfamily N-acetyltransferase
MPFATSPAPLAFDIVSLRDVEVIDHAWNQINFVLAASMRSDGYEMPCSMSPSYRQRFRADLSFVAFQFDSVVGVVLTEMEEGPPSSRQVELCLCNLAVLPDHRSNNIGEMLLMKLSDKARGAGVPAIHGQVYRDMKWLMDLASAFEWEETTSSDQPWLREDINKKYGQVKTQQHGLASFKKTLPPLTTAPSLLESVAHTVKKHNVDEMCRIGAGRFHEPGCQ